MRLLGNKSKLLPQIERALQEREIRGGTFIDIFTGTGSVARHFKSLGFRVIANDLLSACYTQAVAAIEVSAPLTFRGLLRAERDLFQSPGFLGSFVEASRNGERGAGRAPSLPRLERMVATYTADGEARASSRGGRHPELPVGLVFHALNHFVPDHDGLLFRSFSPGGPAARMYFRPAHARRLDGLLEFLRRHYRKGALDRTELHYLLASVIDAADRRANISGTYGAFLKTWQSNTDGELRLEIPEITTPAEGNGTSRRVARGHRVYQEDANALIRRVEGDVLYVDPPYNRRQYAANYHVLEIMAEYHRVEDLSAYEQTLYGKTGLRPYEDLRSDYCVPVGGRRRDGDVERAMRDLIENANVDHIVVSYNEEGLLDREQIGAMLAEFSGAGSFDYEKGFREVIHRRFRSDRDREIGESAGPSRKYRVIEGKERNEISEWLFVASRSARSTRSRGAGSRRTAPAVETAAPKRVARSASRGSARPNAASAGATALDGDVRTVLLLANPDVPECVETGRTLTDRLESQGIDVLPRPDSGDSKHVDLTVILGGDGFLMESIRRLEFSAVPIFGINFGNVGFLMNPRDSLLRLPELIRSRDFSEVEYPVLEARVRGTGRRTSTHLAFNDLALERMSGQSIHFLATLDGVLFNNYSGDGIIVSTSGGSTAYNLAAGGPAVHPEVRAMVLTPLYPHRAAPFHSLQFSILLPLTRVLRLEGLDVEKRPIRLLVDGHAVERVREVEVRDSGRRIRLLRDPREHFIGILARKFIGDCPPADQD